MRLPIFLLLLALAADHVVTQRGLAAGGSEGNILVLWLWEHVPGGPHVLILIWAVILIGISLLISKLKPALGLNLLYFGFFGHLMGFLSWTPFINLAPIWNTFGLKWGLLVLTVVWIIGGMILAKAHQKLDWGRLA